MDAGTLAAPNRFTFDRFTAKALWQPAGTVDGSFFDLGNIDGQTLDEGLAREKIPFARDGAVGEIYDEVVSVAPVWTLKGKQFHSTILPLLYMGTAGPTASQSASGSFVTSVVAVLGKTFDIGKRRNLTSAVVDVASVVKTEGADYYIDLGKGFIRFPGVAAGIAAGDTVNITAVVPALSRETYVAFNNLNQAGTLLLMEMDQHFGAPVVEIVMPGTLSRDKGSDGDPAKTNQWSLRFALEGQPTILRLSEFDELLLDDDSVLLFE